MMFSTMYQAKWDIHREVGQAQVASSWIVSLFCAISPESSESGSEDEENERALGLEFPSDYRRLYLSASLPFRSA
jgi:hypothetical protein